MTLAEKALQLSEDYSLIEDPMERFSAVVARRRTGPELAESDRTDGNLVPGCTSQVWLTGRLENGRCQFRSDADSEMVRALAALLTDFYSDAPPSEVVEMEPDFLESLRLTAQLTPTRRNGLRQIRVRIRALAEALEQTESNSS